MISSIDPHTHLHSSPWPSEWLALQTALPHSPREADHILHFITLRGSLGFTPNMFCQIVNGNEDRIMAVRRRFFDLRSAGRIRYHPSGLMIKNAAGNLVKAWVPGADPTAGTSKYQRAVADNAQLRRENADLRAELYNLRKQLGPAQFHPAQLALLPEF